MSNRYDELDSLRGIAALTVLVGHFLIILPSLKLLRFTPLVSGHEAVIFFFILSGFVLAIPYVGKRRLVYVPFIAKRICRIYIPYLVAITVAILARLLFSRNGIPELSSWFNGAWTTPVSAGIVLNHLALVSSFQNGVFAPVIWSLVHEMRISLVFPLILFLVTRFSFRWSLCVGISLSVLGSYLDFLVNRVLGNSVDYFVTLHYALMFVVGALLARNHAVIGGWLHGLADSRRRLLLISALLLYFCAKDIEILFPKGDYLHGVIVDWLITAGASVIILLSLRSGALSRFLRNQVVSYFGKISYSLYLYHVILLFMFVNLLYGRIPVPAIWGAALIATVAVSTLSFWVIEQPSIRLGRQISDRLTNAATGVRSGGGAAFANE